MMRRRALICVQLWLLAGSLVATVLVSRAGDWHPLGLVFLLAASTLVSDALIIETKKGPRLSGSFLALVLVMAFLGPGPAVAIALLAIAVDALRCRPPLSGVLNNFATYAAFPLAGGLLARWAIAHGADPHQIGYGFVVFGLYVVTLTMNFCLTAVGMWLMNGTTPVRQFREVLVPILPSEAVGGTLVLAFAIMYSTAGFAALAVLVLALIAFQVLTRALLISQARAEQLAVRSTELASLQVGVLAALVRTLALRDKMTARHSAAVARYARAIAEATGCTKEEQELVHTVGLLHDIGKFIFPDSILFADRKLNDEDWEIVKKHPAQGARVVGRVDGYGAVADIIHAHHERIDGRGYPDGLMGPEIPKLSKMISIADTFDVMTARDSYRDPVAREEAIAELRRVSGAQLEAEYVEAFIRILDERDVAFTHTTDADFEAELDFEARVRNVIEREPAAELVA
jgi:putative nucleotidyltransferase with HDIG domain